MITITLFVVVCLNRDSESMHVMGLYESYPAADKAVMEAEAYDAQVYVDCKYQIEEVSYTLGLATKTIWRD